MAGPARSALLRYVLAGIVFAGLLALALRSMQWERFRDLLDQSKPAWLAAAVLLQMTTYLCAAGALQRGIAAAGVTRPMVSLVPLGLAKLFLDQIVPTGGVGGTLLVARALERRRISGGAAIGGLVVNQLALYAAYVIAVFATLGILWARRDLTPAIALLVTVFAVYATAIPALILWIVYKAPSARPRWLSRVRGIDETLKRMAEAPTSALRHPVLIPQAILLQLGIMVLDTATLGVLLRGLGYPIQAWVAFASFVIALMAATLSLLPGGFGSFEAASIASLHFLGVPLETALAATLLFRGLSLWLPLLPGSWVARREISGRRRVRR